MPDSLDDRQHTIPLEGMATLWHSEIGDTSILVNAPFYVKNQMVDFEPGWCWNLRFFVKNPSETDTAIAFLLFEQGASAQLRIIAREGEAVLKTGCHVNLGERTLKDHPQALPIDLPPGALAEAILSIDNSMDRRSQPLAVKLMSRMGIYEHQQRRLLADKPFYNFYLFLLSSLFLMAIFALSQYGAHGDKSYLFYALYGLCCMNRSDIASLIFRQLKPLFLV